MVTLGEPDPQLQAAGDKASPGDSYPQGFEAGFRKGS